jgi:hypothetical protein
MTGATGPNPSKPDWRRGAEKMLRESTHPRFHELLGRAYGLLPSERLGVFPELVLQPQDQADVCCRELRFAMSLGLNWDAIASLRNSLTIPGHGGAPWFEGLRLLHEEWLSEHPEEPALAAMLRVFPNNSGASGLARKVMEQHSTGLLRQGRTWVGQVYTWARKAMEDCVSGQIKWDEAKMRLFGHLERATGQKEKCDKFRSTVQETFKMEELPRAFVPPELLGATYCTQYWAALENRLLSRAGFWGVLGQLVEALAPVANAHHIKLTEPKGARSREAMARVQWGPGDTPTRSDRDGGAGGG